MNFTGHTLYIDITQICGVGCGFCMYADKHKSGLNMKLTAKSIKNLTSLINSPEVKRISISGEGEPLNNIDVFDEILGLSYGGKAFEFITSGFFPHENLAAFYERTHTRIKANGDTCNIRLSSDSHHIEKIKHRPHGFSIAYLQSRKMDGLTFSFRSVDTDRAFTQGYLVEELSYWGLDAKIETRGKLEDVLIVKDRAFGIDYKNLVHPAIGAPPGYLDVKGYISAIEEKTLKPFTFGAINRVPQENGLDVTIKPNGDVFFYGIENECVGNMHREEINWEQLSRHVAQTPLILALYTRPFLDLIGRLENDELMQSILTKVNNPYWVIKAMARHDGFIEKMIAS